LKELQSWVASGKLKVQEDVIMAGEYPEGADRTWLAGETAASG